MYLQYRLPSKILILNEFHKSSGSSALNSSSMVTLNEGHRQYWTYRIFNIVTFVCEISQLTGITL